MSDRFAARCYHGATVATCHKRPVTIVPDLPHCIQERIKGSFLEVEGGFLLGTPRTIGAIAEYSAGMPSSVFTL